MPLAPPSAAPLHASPSTSGFNALVKSKGQLVISLEEFPFICGKAASRNIRLCWMGKEDAYVLIEAFQPPEGFVLAIVAAFSAEVWLKQNPQFVHDRLIIT